MEANYMGGLRTAATSAVATDLLATDDARTLGVFGCGRQAAAHLALLPLVRKFHRFLVCGSPNQNGLPNAKAFSEKMKREFGLPIETVDAQTCAGESDVICTCTNSSTPVVEGRWLRPGTHLNLIGAFQPAPRSVADETAPSSRIAVGTYAAALAEAGDLLIPLKHGALVGDQVVACLHQNA